MSADDPPRTTTAPQIIAELEAMNVQVDYDVIRTGPRTWAIHGRVAYDGEVIAATFATESEAWVALSHPRDHGLSLLSTQRVGSNH